MSEAIIIAIIQGTITLLGSIIAAVAVLAVGKNVFNEKQANAEVLRAYSEIEFLQAVESVLLDRTKHSKVSIRKAVKIEHNLVSTGRYTPIELRRKIQKYESKR